MLVLKYILSFFLIAVFALPQVLPFFIQLKLQHQKWKMLEKLETRQLTTITIKANKLIWIDKGRECLIEGELFDVKECLYTNNQIVLTGLFDQKEKEIKHMLDDYVNNQFQTVQLIQLFKIYSAIVLTQLTEKATYPFPVKSSLPVFLKTFNYRAPFIGINIPPPKKTAVIN